MSETLIRTVVEAAVKGEEGPGGWTRVEAPGVSDKEVSLAIMEAHERGLVKGCDVTALDSPYPEWRIMEPTGASQRYLEQTRPAKKILGLVISVLAAIYGLVKWALPLLLDLRKK